VKFKYRFKIIFFLIFLTLTGFFVWQKFFKRTRELNFKYPISVELILDDFSYQTTTNSLKIKDFFKEKGLKAYSKDLISPDLEQDLRPYSTIRVIRNKEISIKVDGEKRKVNTIRRTIEKLLKDEGIKLNPFDKIDPALGGLVEDGSRIDITRIEKKNITEKQEIEFEIVIKLDKRIKWKKKTIKQEGKNGLKEVEYEMVYKNGELISKTQLNSKIIRKAEPKIITEGGKIEIVSKQKGMASWYAFKGGMYCASVRYPKGAWLRVTSHDNGKQIIVQVNDYGPDPGTGKVIDLDKVAFGKLMSVGVGVINVKIEEIES